MGYATQEQADAILRAVEERDQDREARLPDHRAALDCASTARERLRYLGWRDGIYCPKDGTDFALIQWGSTGVHRGHYMGDWPNGDIYCGDFLIPPHAVMFKAMADLTDAERTDLAVSIERDKQFMDWQFKTLSETQG